MPDFDDRLPATATGCATSRLSLEVSQDWTAGQLAPDPVDYPGLRFDGPVRASTKAFVTASMVYGVLEARQCEGTRLVTQFKRSSGGPG